MQDVGTWTDKAILEELGGRLSRYRLDRNLTQADLAKEAGVHKNTVFRLEAGESTQTKNLIRILRALGLLDNLAAAIPEPVQSPLQRLKEQEQQRKRAVSKKSKRTDATDTIDSNWSWDDNNGSARS